MAAAPVFKHQRAHIGFGGSVYDAVTHCINTILLVPAVDQPNRDILVRIKGINQKPVPAVNYIYPPQVRNDNMTIGASVF